MMSYQGKWGRAEVVGEQIQKDPAYRIAMANISSPRRTVDKADAQLKLAAWCDQKGLKAQAQTHYEQVIQLDPTRLGLEAPWFQETGEPLGQARSGRRGEAGGRTTKTGRQALEAHHREDSGRPAEQGCGAANRAEQHWLISTIREPYP